VRLFTVPVRAISPSKSQVKISVRGQDCDTPSVTVATVVLQQYLTLYPQSLNEILVWFGLNFKFKLISFILNQVI
jgi:hypothetical protein